jgi:hypothetical protein
MNRTVVHPVSNNRPLQASRIVYQCLQFTISRFAFHVHADKCGGLVEGFSL